jgi:hypothetical protein
MNKENENDEFAKKMQRLFNATRQVELKQQEENKVVFNSISDAFKAFSEYSKTVQLEEKKWQTDYFTWLIEYINQLDVKSGLLYLKKEKSKYEQKIIKANIDRDGYARKTFENVINITLKPLINIWEEKDQNPEQQILINDKPTLSIQPAHSELTINEVAEIVVSNECQIVCAASKEQIRDYFYILTKEKNPSNGKPYMLQEDVDRMIRTNFSVYGEASADDYFDINLSTRQKGVLRYFVYQFYLKYEFDQIGTKYKYVNFLIRNFKLFKEDDPAILNGNMNSSKKPSDKNIIPV